MSQRVSAAGKAVKSSATALSKDATEGGFLLPILLYGMTIAAFTIKSAQTAMSPDKSPDAVADGPAEQISLRDRVYGAYANHPRMVTNTIVAIIALTVCLVILAMQSKFQFDILFKTATLKSSSFWTEAFVVSFLSLTSELLASLINKQPIQPSMVIVRLLLSTFLHVILEATGFFRDRATTKNALYPGGKPRVRMGLKSKWAFVVIKVSVLTIITSPFAIGWFFNVVDGWDTTNSRIVMVIKALFKALIEPFTSMFVSRDFATESTMIAVLSTISFLYMNSRRGSKMPARHGVLIFVRYFLAHALWKSAKIAPSGMLASTIVRSQF